jgi:hypothetical protein
MSESRAENVNAEEIEESLLAEINNGELAVPR